MCRLECDKHDNQLPSLSGVHGLKDFFCIDLLLESFYGYSLKHFHKSTFHHKRTQEDGHYRENSSNHELLTVRGVDCRALLKIFEGLVTLKYTASSLLSLTSGGNGAVECRCCS